MPEVIYPGVFLDEVRSGPQPIQGVGTSTTGFVGSAPAGPTDSPVLVTEVAEFERAFGREGDLWRAVEAFFAHGGSRLYVQRVPQDDCAAALRALESIDEIALVAAPGAGAPRELVEHAERARYRFALLDAPEELAPFKDLDSSYAALYRAGEERVPPSAVAAAIYARTKPMPHGDERTDSQRTEPGVNVVHVLGDGTVRIDGSATLSSDPEWKYVAMRRYFIYLEHSIDRGTQWTVFEPNNEELWAAVRRTISDFLFEEFRVGALAGSRPEEAFFVRCGRDTMTQDDLDEGRLVCVVGVAPVRPAEFVEIQIGRWTADHHDP